MSLPKWTASQLHAYLTEALASSSMDGNQANSGENNRRSAKIAFLLTTPFCGTCKLALQMAGIVHQAKPDWLFAELSTTDHRQRFEDWRIESVPCIILLSDAAETDRWYRIGSITELWQRLERFFENDVEERTIR